jgi:hypothetical protein
MARYVTKPVEIEAHRFDVADPKRDAPDWVLEALRADVIMLDDTDDTWYVQTLESGGLAPVHRITDGDFVICGVAGEIYPCKPAIFEATYEAVA